MPDRWQTYPLEFSGGLISNLSPLQHGSTAPGSARILTNFEPSTDGGYRRIEGFEKFNSNTVKFGISACSVGATNVPS